jgi:DegV family protein with EDD domain
MPGIRVVTDSSCDLPAALAADQRIEIVPLTIRFGEEELVDGRDLTPRQFWARCARSPMLPETAAPAPGAFEAVFRRIAAEGADGIVCVNISSRLSATMQSAQIAGEAVASDIPVRVIDSRFASMAQGLLALAAARMAAQGKALDDVAGTVEDLVPRTRLLAVLDTLENLKKGGRIGGAQAFIGTMLSIKPVIQVVDGAVEQESKQRTRSRSLRYLADKVKEFGPIEALTVMHGDAPDLDEMLDLLDGITPRADILVGDIGAVIGTHAGPRAIGVTFHTGR